MSSTLREVVYSIRHRGCPVSDASAAVPGVRISTVSKIEKHDDELESLQHISGDDADVAAYIDQLEVHDVPTNVRPFTTGESEETYIVLTVEYDRSLPSIASVFSEHDCFQPRKITVERGFENWSIYHEATVDIESVSERLREQDVTLDVKRNVGATAFPETHLSVTGNETSGLTDRQFEVLVTARRMGYYDVHRSVTMQDVADEMGLSSATVCEHLNRAESHIISTAVDAVSPTITTH